ncbi:Transcriptional regulatory protein, C terminal [Paramicrobacterium humi]|uniref:Transcriptional regulatory protein, C terminal n=1 Tax=Paramicrobacterium humi TaxID=640635 RepID=A0A1H4IQK1_9MICO|nr:winged helix-turn-helix domain-containing protein [Microbacterium humi]SEB36374.1 Transcriptional regulatory protein, C terminal [Microbacterium humi]
MAELAASDPPDIGVLGPVTVHGTAVAGLLPRRLIAALALAGGRSVGADELIDALWGDDAPANSRAALQTLVSRTRSLTGHDAIELTPGRVPPRRDDRSFPRPRRQRLRAG